MKQLTLIALVLGIVVPTASAADYRSPDRRDAADRMLAIDVRSPDTRELAQPQPLGSQLDAVEAVRHDRGISAETVFVSAPGFDFVDAAVGAAATLGLLLAAGGMVIVVSRRRSQLQWAGTEGDAAV